MASGYRERLWPAWWLWLVVVLVGLGFGLVVAPFGAEVMAAVAVVMTIILGALLLAWTTTVGLDGDSFVAGRARIPVLLLGAPEVLDAAGMRHAHGPGLDARAYLCLRGWIGDGAAGDRRRPARPDALLAGRRRDVLDGWRRPWSAPARPMPR